jgi:general secretion pathway protein H
LTDTRGFTLIELSVILVLLGIFSLLLIPRLDRFGRGELDASARRLRGTIKFLFNEAALTGREHRLIYDLEHGRYRAMVLNPGGELTELRGPGKATRLPEGIRFQDLVLRNRGTFSTGEVTVRIHPTGWLEESLIHLQDQSGAQRTLRIAPLTGAADIDQGYKGF